MCNFYITVAVTKLCSCISAKTTYNRWDTNIFFDIVTSPLAVQLSRLPKILPAKPPAKYADVTFAFDVQSFISPLPDFQKPSSSTFILVIPTTCKFLFNVNLPIWYIKHIFYNNCFFIFIQHIPLYFGNINNKTINN